MELESMIKLVLNVGLTGAMCVVFLYRDMMREKEHTSERKNTQEWINEKMVEMIEASTTALTDAASAKKDVTEEMRKLTYAVGRLTQYRDRSRDSDSGELPRRPQ